MSSAPTVRELLQTAWDRRRVGDYDEARSLVDRAEKLCLSDDVAALGRIWHVRAQFESDYGNLEQALEFYQRSLAHFKQSQDVDAVAHSTRHIADTLSALGRQVEAQAHYEQALALYRANSNTSTGDLTNAVAGYARLLEKRGRTDEARRAWEETRELYAGCNLQEGVDEANRHIENLFD